MKIQKPWGYEELIEVNEKYIVKRLMMKAGCRCSLQYHRDKVETIIILGGELKLTYGTSLEKLESRMLSYGCSMTLKNGTLHRMEALVNTIYLEASTPELQDVVRIEDDYGRA